MTAEQAAERSVYIELIRNESRVIGERLRAMLTFQGFLFATVGVAASHRLFALALLVSGMAALSCLPWFWSVRMSYRGCEQLSRDYDARKPGDAPPLDACGITSREFSLLPEVFLPVALAVTWLLVASIVAFDSRRP
jgi:hypothetical protein